MTVCNGGTAPLTPYQLDILDLMANGLTHKDIADQFQRSPNTIRNLQATIFRKLGVHSAPHAVAVGFRQGLLD